MKPIHTTKSVSLTSVAFTWLLVLGGGCGSDPVRDSASSTNDDEVEISTAPSADESPATSESLTTDEAPSTSVEASASTAPASTTADAPTAAVTSDDLLDLLDGDGAEFESAESRAVAEQGDIEPPTQSVEVLEAPEEGSCCPDGNCVCRGNAPTRQTIERNGPFRYASYSSGFSTRGYGGATIYYPTDATAPFSAVVMCPGFTALKSSIAAWGPFFASHGIVLMVIDTITTLDQVVQREDQLLAALDALKQENTRVRAPLLGKLSATRYGLAGWSMGGGATWLASAAHPELKSAVTLAGHNLTALGGAGSRGSRVPTLMMNGALDVTFLGGLGQSESAYDNIPETTAKLLYVMAFEGHLSWGGPTTNGNASGRYMMAWQKAFLEGDVRYRPFLLERGPNASTWRTNLR
jgi:pimeloyl-ACP methyl ester carboxylesterase